MQMSEKVGKSRNTVFFPMICGSGGSKSRLAKAAGAEPAGKMRDEKVHAVVVRSTFPSQNVQNTQRRSTFGSCDVEKVHTVVARSTFGSQSVKTPGFGPLLEVAMSKKWTPLWREAQFEVKMFKAHHSRTTFGSCDVEKVHAVVARSTFPSQNVQSTTCSRHFWRFRCWKSARRCGAKHMSKSKYKHLRATSGSSDVDKLHAVVARSRFEVKMYKTLGVRTTFGGSDVEKVHAVVAGSTFPSQKKTKHTMYRPFLEVQM